MTSLEFEVLDACDLRPSALIDVLEAGYGRPFSREWFGWKHRDCPWGASRRYVAVDDQGILGVVFALPWKLRVGDKIVSSSRLVDGATAPRAVRRGVFRSVVAAELANWDPDDQPGLIMATATPEARAAHVKNGATALTPIRSVYRGVMWSRASVVTAQTIDSFEQSAADGRVTTAWDACSLRWRLDPRSGTNYQISSLSQGTNPHGVVHRTISQRGVRILVVSAHWGHTRDVQMLIRALAWHTKAVGVLAPVGTGAADPMPRIRVGRGRSFLCIWDRRRAESESPLSNSDAWAMCGLDLEGVI